MRSTEKGLLGDLKARAKKVEDTRQREAVAEQYRLRKENAARRQLKEMAKAVRLAKDLCIEAAWKKQDHVIFPKLVEEFKYDVAQALGLTIGNLLANKSTRFFGDTVSIVERLQPILLECFGKSHGASLFKRLQKCKIGDWYGKNPNKELRDAIPSQLQELSRGIRGHVFSLNWDICSELGAINTLIPKFKRNPVIQSKIETYIKHKVKFSDAYEHEISAWGALPASMKIEIAGKQLAAIGVSVSDVQEFFEMASFYEGRPKNFLTTEYSEDVRELRHLNNALHEWFSKESACVEQLLPLCDQLDRKLRAVSQKKGKNIAILGRLNKAINELIRIKGTFNKQLLPLLNQLDRQVRMIPQTDETMSIALGSIGPGLKDYLFWNRTDGNCSSTVALLHWLSGTKGQSLRRKLLAYFRESADEGRQTAEVAVAMRSSGAVICLKNLPCEVGFPCDMDDIASMLKSLGLPVSSRELESGEINFKFSW